MARRESASPAEAAIAAVIGPLRNAVKIPERFHDPDRAIALAAARACSGALPLDLRKALREVRDAFAEELDDAARRAAVEHALARLEPFSSPGYATRALAQSPRVLAGLGPRRAEQLA